MFDVLNTAFCASQDFMQSRLAFGKRFAPQIVAIKVGDKLTTRNFGTCTRGFAAAEDAGVAVCVLPGTELAFSSAVTVTYPRFLAGWKVETLAHATAIFRQVNKNEPWKHHDAL